MCKKERYAVETILAQAGNRNDGDARGSISTPIYLSSNYRHKDLEDVRNFDERTQYSYSRLETPTKKVLSQTLATLEHGTQAFALSSGMAAIQLAFSIFKSGDHIVTLDDLYGGSFRYFDQLHEQYDMDFSKWNGKSIRALQGLLRPNTRAVWIETPSNPTMKEIDIVAVADTVHAVDPTILVMVDNTFYTPIYQLPLTQGADVVVHSATKYLSGHNDLLGGVVVAKGEKLSEKLMFNYKTTGATLDPFDSWLLLRSLKTLPLRMRAHTANAQEIVAYLKQEAKIEKVMYPGKGGMISFYVQDEEIIDKMFKSLKVISFAESLGGVESLLTIPYLQTHRDMEEAERLRLGITPKLLRLSVGLENAADLIKDLKQALA
ncbi:cystathionine gamma-synthase [Liquorilactobacillus sucicola DSM 21376 = JCM 15457]|uniref:Cystathionine gamma-synthase n=1 Tax=Liquorilactobacillus sucicola DSM 21376 = JCM 15457 TaxID=1423806 RepID=A0A023CZY6_9LACO|nr:PLP-dependent transferase [Liquorilactobacillus sucicola]KRN06790.1 cystathionine gamma-synthase [Liquorilactobacillus sucicola DSM 21376 = JCM 15457]GAJ27070.1 cystathionine gamma-synthase [Liquorilactobacillus sucicola DSM 21376 = JCM 15457]